VRETTETGPDGGEWIVRRITGSSSTKPYRCPGCHQVIRPATPHIVAWPAEAPWWADDAVSLRRHWHTGCWRSRK
jgi:hypothetical protein